MAEAGPGCPGDAVGAAAGPAGMTSTGGGVVRRRRIIAGRRRGAGRRRRRERVGGGAVVGAGVERRWSRRRSRGRGAAGFAATGGAGTGAAAGGGVASGPGRSGRRRRRDGTLAGAQSDSLRSTREAGRARNPPATWNEIGGPSGSDAKRHVLSVRSMTSAYGRSPSRIAASATVPSGSSVTSATTLAGPFAPAGKAGAAPCRSSGMPAVSRHVRQLQGEGDGHGQAYRHRPAVHLGDLVFPLAGGGERRLVERGDAAQHVGG